MKRALAAACILLGIACSGAQGPVSSQAMVFRATQEARIDFYRALHEQCMERESIEAYRECMIPAREIARLADVYRAALNAAQASIDLGEDPDLSELFASAADLVRALKSAGVPIPAALLRLVNAS